ncbi:MAG: pilus assembly protein [Actinobacteria bacterium]|nr:pilus assembly protein [Actinomycetota bacterium]
MTIRDQRGSATAEVAILAPALVLMLLLVLAAGRVPRARLEVYGAAAEAARAASVRQEPGPAAGDARAVADAALAARGVTCRDRSVDVDTGALSPGGSVSVTVACTVDLSDLGLLGLPATRRVAAEGFEVVDTHRSE